MVEKRKKRKIQQKQKQRQTVKQSVVINLQKRRALAPSAGRSQPSYRPPSTQFIPMPQYNQPSFNQELFNQKLETLKADILQNIPKQIPAAVGGFNPYREAPISQMLNKPPAEPIFSSPPSRTFSSSDQFEEPEEEMPVRRRGRGRPVGSTNRPPEVILQEKEEKLLRRRKKND